MNNDRRLIEDFLPIQAISKEASREKSVRKGHISTLHLWWARRPLVACRAAVYGALVPASLFIPENGPDNKKQSLGRANAAKFIERLCKYPGNPAVIKEAQSHILEAHAERLTRESGTDGPPVTVEDIEEGRAPRPKVLDMFAGGGAIPLEALRLGCEAYALDLNPVAHIIELCTLVYPQKYGKPDPNARGMTGPASYDQAGRLIHQTTWGGLADEVRYWGERVLKKVKAEIGDLYPLIPDPDYKKDTRENDGGTGGPPVQKELFITRRNLPHWELGGNSYFITYRCASGMALNEAARTVVMDNWKHWHGKRYLLHAAVVMSDHVHVIITPRRKEDGIWFSLEEILHTNKGFTAHEINKSMNRSGHVWQDERFDRIMRNEEEFIEKWNYMRDNPVKAGLVEKAEDYLWLYQNPEAWIEEERSTGQVEQAARLLMTGQRPVPHVPPDSSLEKVPPGYLVPVAYLWTRTVRCKNPSCGATVPLVKQTWLCKKKGRFVALKIVTAKGEEKARFEVVEATTEKGLGFDPSAGSKGGNATCPFCGTVADSSYVKAEGCAGRMGQQFLAIAATRKGTTGKIYLGGNSLTASLLLDDDAIRPRLNALFSTEGIAPLEEPIEINPRSMDIDRAGFSKWGQLFTSRQQVALMSICAAVRRVGDEMAMLGYETGYIKAVVSMLGCGVSKFADFCSTLCMFNYTGGRGVKNSFPQQSLPMVWDFAETNPFNPAGASWIAVIEDNPAVIEQLQDIRQVGQVKRGSAQAVPLEAASVDAVITDPPYYDNVSYSNLSDFFLLWLRRSIGHLYPEHFASSSTPKKQEIIAASYRHGGDRSKAREFYENRMQSAFAEAYRVLKPTGQMTVVYAHKTTLGWATLVDALRRAGFTVTEAWPLDTERKGRVIAIDTAALASSIFLIARKREGSSTGSYEEEVRSDLERIVRERVDSLWKMGITGADLVIAAVGAGLRAFTRFSRVEYANGEEVPAEKFLAEVEGVVLETLLEKIFVSSTGGSPVHQDTGQRPVPLGSVDGPSRFYVLWRYAYKAAEMDAGEAIVFTYGQHVELDGPQGLSGQRPEPLIEKKKGKYRLRDFAERGDNEKLGMPVGQAAGLASAGWQPAPLIDILHRILWLVENQPRNLNQFLDEARPDRERLRLVAQALAGTALEGGQASGLSHQHTVATTPAEQAALKKLVANWRALIDERLSNVDLKSAQIRMS